MCFEWWAWYNKSWTSESFKTNSYVCDFIGMKCALELIYDQDYAFYGAWETYCLGFLLSEV